MKSLARKQPNPKIIAVGALVLLLVVIISACTMMHQPETKVVKKFYTYEQNREFWHSYDLFHSQMKERFSRDGYVQDRDHIFVEHFGVSTYDLEIGSSNKLSEWQMSENHEPLAPVYQVPVTKTYNSSYGVFSIHQDVFVAKEDNEWRLLWSYNYEE
ncbi:hypothetical protein [Desertibacillus haloalkaliphilus]|uniref:hypothetical protein n=1 Tax=Desertibacillus haloalkaliphilus TaxID=1328930 RepID=UPI001C2744DE|nr:hypothetical protein [Desertibacillus haloalkaliphilus]MBU8906499.1 hypothetical protein [Desertibacillus haloalkaliphilus]